MRLRHCGALHHQETSYHTAPLQRWPCLGLAKAQRCGQLVHLFDFIKFQSYLLLETRHQMRQASALQHLGEWTWLAGPPKGVI